MSRVLNKGVSVGSMSVTQVTFTAVKRRSDSLGSHWVMMAARDRWWREMVRGL